jgi:membrane protease YdiL (CAAX protease family)
VPSARRLAQLLLGALVAALPVVAVVSRRPDMAAQYAACWLILAGSGIVLIGAGTRIGGRGWLAHRFGAVGLLVVVVLVVSSWVLGQSVPLDVDAPVTRVVAAAAMAVLAAVLILGVLVPTRLRGAGGFVAGAVSAAVMSYTLMYASGTGLGGVVRSALQSLLAEIHPGTALWVLVGGISIELAMLLSVLALGPAPNRASLRELGLRALPLERMLLVGGAVVGLMLGFDVFSTILAGQFGLDPAQVSNAPDFRSGPPTLAQAVIGDSVAPGIIEELFFRGLLFGFLLRARQPLWLAILISSGLFAVGHLTPDMTPGQMVAIGVPIFVSGGLLAVTYVLTGSLLPGMLAHTLGDLPIAVGLALGPEAKGSVGAVLVALSLFAWLLLGSSAVRERVARGATAGNRLERLGASIVPRLSPHVHLGVVDIVPVRHLLLLGGVWLFCAALRLPDPLIFAAFVYAVFQAGRLVSEGVRAAVAILCGGRVVQVRLMPLVQAQVSDDVHARRAVAAADIATRICVGLGLVGSAASLTGLWPVAREEVLALLGWLYVGGAVLSLLPLPGAEFEGALLWRRSWAGRFGWLPYSLVLLLGLGCAGLTALQFPDGYIRAWFAEIAQPAPLVILGMWVATAMVVLSRLKQLQPKRDAIRA